jgi:aldehyde dehydrogenase (NAD+)
MTAPFTQFKGLYIGSNWIPPQSGEHEPVINPANEDVIGEAPVGGLLEAEAALNAARSAFDSGVWSELPQEARTEMMRRLHATLNANADRIKELMIVEGGITRLLANGMQFNAPMQLVERLLARSLIPTLRHLPLDTAINPFNPAGPMLIGSGVVVREPLGVVTAITPYNAPFLVNISKIFPALLAGNTVILKPSPFTPFSALLLGEMADQIGLPPGVFNVVTGGIEVGDRLTSDPRVDMVTFTGSEAVGSAILGQSAKTLKKVLLELGGKSALIVREDANVQKAAMEGLFQVSTHCGQGCALATRHLVHNSIRPAYIETMKAMVGQLTLGDPSEMTTVVGPLIRGGARDRVERMVANGQAEGAKLVIGGTRPDHLKKGFFYNVTVFDDVENNMSIAQDEIFGPVAAVIGFDTDEEAVKIANDSRYGLYGGIHSRDPAKAYAMALKMRTGGVVLNGGLFKQNDAPFGGYKHSGLGREYGDQWMNEYTHEKSIVFPIGI